MWKDHLCIVMAIEHYNPLGLIRSLGEAGVHPVYIAIKGRTTVASSSKYISRCHYADTVEAAYTILMEEYGDYGAATGLLPYLFTSDDKSIGFLDAHYEELKDKFITFNAGAANRINFYMDKFNILELAKKHGLNVLEARVCRHGEVPEDLEYPVITKAITPNVGGWKSDVFICHHAEELRMAYQKIKAHTVLVQKYIEKKNEYCMEGFSACRGTQTLIAIASTYNYLLPDYYSPYMTIRNVDNPALEQALKAMLAEIGFEGIFEIECLIDQDDTLYFSEINFRNSGWSYAATCAGMPLAVLFAETQDTGCLREDARKEIGEGFTAMLEPVDYAKRVKTGSIRLSDWLICFKQAGCCYYYNPEDPQPWNYCVENWDRLG